jgi:hypothetical protein
MVRLAQSLALAVILIVKANKNRISYGNTIELNFLLSGLNSLLKYVVNNVCLRPVNAFVYDCTSKVSGLASFRTGIWVLFG